MEGGFSLRQERRRTKEKVDMVNHQGAMHLKDSTMYTYAPFYHWHLIYGGFSFPSS